MDRGYCFSRYFIPILYGIEGFAPLFSIYRTDLPSTRGTMKLSRSKGLNLHSVMRRKRSYYTVREIRRFVPSLMDDEHERIA